MLLCDIIAVSYTHLDVYKRQELRGANGTGKTTLLRAIAGLHQQKFGQIAFSGLDDAANNEYVVLMGHLDAIKSNESVLAVSYTHLDVYKRQIK